MNSLDGKVAIVTGSSRGIGKAIAIELAKKGVSIVLNGRNSSRLEQATKELKKIQKAYTFAFYSHDGQLRQDGSKYITHPVQVAQILLCLLYTSPSPRDATLSRMPSSA